ncbi:MAG: hypothetical protein AAGI30_13680 [Planctomycetota bacterium]
MRVPLFSRVLWFGVVALACGASVPLHAQVVINEVFTNPPNGGDDAWEFIELYGEPGYDLTGYAVVLIDGGRDTNGDDIPDFITFATEVEEAFSLDGWSIGPNGLFVLYNNSAGNSGLAQFSSLNPQNTRLTENTGFNFAQPESPANKRFLDGASFSTLHLPSTDTVGNLENDRSVTVLLLRGRPEHAITTLGISVYDTGYAWRKDVPIDIDYNGRADFGDETAVTNGRGQSSNAAGAPYLAEPVQIVDEIAWSNQGGKEYNTPGRGLASNEFSATPGFNPDCVSRVRYITGAPDFGGFTIQGDGDLVLRRAADESWVYGETRDYTDADPFNADSLSPGAPQYFEYYGRPIDRGPDEVLDTADDELHWLAPTDPFGNLYSYDGPGDDNPLDAPFFDASGALDASGDLLFEPYDVVGFEWTPGQLNDAPATALGLIDTDIERQFRFVKGDFTFDAVVNAADRDLIEAAAANSTALDDTATLVRDFNTDDPADDVTYTGFEHQLSDFNAVLAMIRMDLTDGSTGEWTSGQVIELSRVVAWGGSVTLDDAQAFTTAFVEYAAPTVERPDAFDLAGYAIASAAADPMAELTGDTPAAISADDWTAYLSFFDGISTD